MLHIDAVINDRQSVYTGRRSVHLGHELIQLSFIAADILVIVATALAVDATVGARLGFAGDLTRGSILAAAMFAAIWCTDLANHERTGWYARDAWCRMVPSPWD